MPDKQLQSDLDSVAIPAGASRSGKQLRRVGGKLRRLPSGAAAKKFLEETAKVNLDAGIAQFSAHTKMPESRIAAVKALLHNKEKMLTTVPPPLALHAALNNEEKMQVGMGVVEY